MDLRQGWQPRRQNKYFEPQQLKRVTYLSRVVNNDGSRDNKPGEIPNLIIFCIVPAIRVENACVNTFKQDLEPLVKVFTSTAWLVQAQREIRRGTNPGCNHPITHLKSHFLHHIFGAQCSFTFFGAEVSAFFARRCSPSFDVTGSTATVPSPEFQITSTLSGILERGASMYYSGEQVVYHVSRTPGPGPTQAFSLGLSRQSIL